MPLKAFSPEKLRWERNCCATINDTVGFPKLSAETKLHVKTLHQMFGPKRNPTASNLFGIVAYLQRQEGVRLQVRTSRAVASTKIPPKQKKLGWRAPSK